MMMVDIDPKTFDIKAYLKDLQDLGIPPENTILEFCV